MSTVCQQKSVVPRQRGVVVALEGVRLHKLALVIADELRRGQGSTCHFADAIDDVEFWRRAARRAGRIMGVPVRTGLAPDASKVWACEGP
jgi:predicted nucleic acid-binding protein